MDVAHAQSNTFLESNDQSADNERGNWHRRLRCRKFTPPTPADQSYPADPKAEAGLEKQPSVSQSCQGPIKQEPHAKSLKSPFSLHCPECKDGVSFSANDFLKHFEQVHRINGSPLVFLCDMCSFTAPEFSMLKQHQLVHKEALLGCDICNDDVKHTFAQLVRHCRAHHCLNGQFTCEKCNFATVETKTFAKHLGQHQRPSEENSLEVSDKGVKKSPPADIEPPKDDVTKSPATRTCKASEGSGRKCWWKRRDSRPKAQVSQGPGLKFFLTSEDLIKDTQWMTQSLLPFSGAGLLDEYGVLLNPEKTLEETQQFLERTMNGSKTWTLSLKHEQESFSLSCPATPLPEPKQEHSSIPQPGFLNTSTKNLNNLIEKNKISIPSDCTTEVRGFKVVDGKKHLIVKVIPSTKQEPWTEDSPPFLASEISNGMDSYGLPVRRLAPQTCVVKEKSNSNVLPAKSSAVSCQDDLPASNNSTSPSNQSENPEYIQCQTHGKDQGSKPPHSENMDTPNGIHTEGSHDARNIIVKPHMSNVEKADEQNSDGQKRNEAQPLSSNCLHTTGDLYNFEAQLFSSFKTSESTKDIVESESSMFAVLQHCRGGNILGKITEKNAAATHQPLCDLESGTDRVEPGKPPLPVPHNCAAQVVLEPPAAIIETSGLSHILEEHTDLINSDEHAVDSAAPIDEDVAGLPMETQPTTSILPQTQGHIPPCATTLLVENSQEGSSESRLSHIPSSGHCGTRKRQGTPFTDTSLEPMPKSRKPSNQSSQESPASADHWTPAPRHVERTLRLLPWRSTQPITRPRSNQPVVVLNHPDADIPEVTNIMRMIRKHNGRIQKVSLSQGTITALSDLNCDAFQSGEAVSCHASHCRREWPPNSAKERFVLKLKLKRMDKTKYLVVPSTSAQRGWTFRFSCWFCGRIFANQEAWVGHGQRHLMEATRGWDKLFKDNAHA